ncbi:aldehyde dehydrogenase family protein [Streptomyces sp. NPDC056683]|uniref:aldehyde dehydrogenase family protein n=1 Tax=Streptomyces sp. NPDC056683 TaxID=3345910 RepID=UPI00367EE97F
MAPVELLIGSRWQAARGSGQTRDVTSPFDGSTVGTVALAGTDAVEAALAAAERGAAVWRLAPAHERMRILLRAAELADERAPKTAQTISAESGKTITEATGEASRSGDLIRLAALAGREPAAVADPDWNHRKATA